MYLVLYAREKDKWQREIDTINLRCRREQTRAALHLEGAGDGAGQEQEQEAAPLTDEAKDAREIQAGAALTLNLFLCNRLG